MRVVIVDDHILFREGLASLLRAQEGIEVIGEAGSVSEAVALLIRTQPDLVLLDTDLPDGCGLEVMRSVVPDLPEMKVIILTVDTSDDLLFSAITLGARGYLLKNIPAANLVASLRAIERGEVALSRQMTARVVDEFSRIGSLQGSLHPALKSLTLRELEVLRLLEAEPSNREIANRLSISENTVKIHIHNILEKLKMQNRYEAAEFSRRYLSVAGTRGAT